MRRVAMIVLLAAWAVPAAALDLVPVGTVGTTGPVTLDEPSGVAFAADGSLWVCDVGLGRVLRFSRAGEHLGEIAPHPPQWRPTGVAVLTDGRLAVAAGDVTLHDADGSGMAALGLSGDCYGITSDGAGGFWVTQAALASVRHWPDPIVIGSTGATGITIAANGAGFTTSAVNSRLYRVEGIGGFPGLSIIYVPPLFSSPLDIESFRGALLVADTWHHRLVEASYELRIVGMYGAFGAGAGQFSMPTGIAVAPDGLVAVSELGNHRVSLFASAPIPALATSWGRIKALVH